MKCYEVQAAARAWAVAGRCQAGGPLHNCRGPQCGLRQKAKVSLQAEPACLHSMLGALGPWRMEDCLHAHKQPFCLRCASHGCAAALMTMPLQARLTARAGTADAGFTASACTGAAHMGSLLTRDMLGDLDHNDRAPLLVLVVMHVHLAGGCLCLYHVPGNVVCPARCTGQSGT